MTTAASSRSPRRVEVAADFARFPCRLTPLGPRVREILEQTEPPPALVADGSKRAEGLGELLCGPSGVGGLRYEVIGSVARRTANAPLSDVDLLVSLDEAEFVTGGQRKAPATVLRALQERLTQRYGELERKGYVEVRAQTHSVGLRFQSDRRVNIDVVPAFALEQGIYEIPERGTRRWIPTSPPNQLVTLNQLDQPQGPVRQAIRLLRHWRRFGRSQPVPSMAMEVLALYARKHGVDAEPLRLFEATLRWIAHARLRTPITLTAQELRRAPLVIMDTGVLGNNLTAGVAAAARDALVRRARETLAALETAAERVERGSDRGVDSALRRFLNIK